MATSKAALARSPTGIPRLDSALQGGFPVGGVILLSGQAGTGKTMLAMRWLFAGAAQKEPGVYLTMTEPVSKLIKHSSTLTFYDPAAVDKGLLVLEDLRASEGFLSLEKEVGKPGVEALVEDIKVLVKRTKAKRLALDSVTAICRFLNDAHLIRHFIFKLGTVLSYLGCTALLVSEVTESNYSAYDVEEFISDGIIHLERGKHGGARTLEIVKMRGTSFEGAPQRYKITADGITFYEQPSFDVGKLSTERLASGIQGLDTMLCGGILKHSVTLLNGASGTGKSTFGLQFLIEGVRAGERCLLVNFEEAREQLIRNMHTAFAQDLERLEKGGLLKVECVLPESRSMLDHLDHILSVMREFKPERVVLDSLTALEKVGGKTELLSATKHLALAFKKGGATAMLITAGEAIMNEGAVTETRLSTIPDNIILLRYVEIEANMRRFIAVLKQRGSDHDKELREYVITTKGLEVHDPFKGMQGVFTGNVQQTMDRSALVQAFHDLAKG
ncbi:AAA family ATPase [Candidatus Woesearchaeota archaeon]|nr:AAA family ATPase [Candidatus Woesearchaeota archaeon]